MTDEFIVAACAPPANHPSGTLEQAEAILAAHPEIAGSSIHTAAILGDADGVARRLAEDPASATARAGPYGWDVLTHLCFSRYLRLRGGGPGFERAASALLDAGADPDTGFFFEEHQPEPTFESALYGAAGVAHHAAVTRLLLARGADPNAGGEVAYHAAEGFDDAAMLAVVESGRLEPGGLTTMLHRKLDWTHLDGVRALLDHGADPNALSAWGDRALHHALARDNALPLLEALLDHGADPRLATPRDGLSAFAAAARAGRRDALELFERRGFAVALDGDDAFFEALARADGTRARRRAAADPDLVRRLDDGVAATLAGAGNMPAVALALDLGFTLGRDALRLAVWRERTETVRLLLERGAPVTPDVIELAERALSEISDFTPHRSREILDALTR